MRIFFVGDYKANTGPSNVNKNLLKYLPDNIYSTNSSFFLTRCLELIIKSILSKVIVISGFSLINLLCICTAKLLGKKIIYISHGCISYENKINELNKVGIEKVEEIYFNASNCILCVSENFMYWFNEHYPKYKEKTSFLNNGIEWDLLDKTNNTPFVEREPNTIVTMGGGRPQKNNLLLCEAIEILNKRSKNSYKLIVLGRDYRDTEKIKSYDFVDYVGQVDNEDAYKYLQKSYLFIQNSLFEPFGLAPIEAILNGCNVLLSKNVGAIGIIKSISKSDIINNCMDPIEIANRIEFIKQNPNNERLLAGFDRDKTSYKTRANELYELAIAFGRKK